jgi:hypothetical protein
MKPRSAFVAAFGLAAAFSPALSRSDEGEVSPPPPVPAAQMPGPARVAPDPPAGWIPPNGPQVPAASPAASPQSIAVPYAAAPPVAPQTVTFQLQVVPPPATVAVQAMPVASGPSCQVVHSKGPGPIGRMVGKVGEYLAVAGMTRLYVPTPEVQQVVYTPAQPVSVPSYVAAPNPIQASPQSSILAAPRKGWLHR